jgi:hypothetical protein
MDGIFIKVTVFISVMCVRIYSSRDKRLVLHSNEDLLNVISKLVRKVESLDAEVTALKVYIIFIIVVDIVIENLCSR